MQWLSLRGKWRIQAHGHTLVLPKKAGEKASHVWLKGLMWTLYLPRYPHLMVERAIENRYKPDLVAFAQRDPGYPGEAPLFWGECGQVSPSKLEKLFRQYPGCHFCIAKWGSVANWEQLLDKIIQLPRRRAPIDLLCFPEDSFERHQSDEGQLSLTLAEVLVRRWESQP